MSRIASTLARAGLALVVAGLVLALLRWAPLYAEPPVDLRALPLVVPALLLACLAARTGRPRRAGPVGALAVGLALTVGALLLLARLRPNAGLVAHLATPAGLDASLPPSAVDLAPDDLEPFPRSRKWRVQWIGPLRAPRSGTYRLAARGRGSVEVELDGRSVLRGAGDPLDAEQALPIGVGDHVLRVRYENAGPAPRLQLRWTLPLANGAPGRASERVSPRYLGEPSPLVFRVTDALALLAAALAALLVLALPWDAPAPLPAPSPVSRSELLGATLALTVLVALATWPLVTVLASAGPFWQPDGRLNAWILAWDVHALLHAPTRLFAAPIFHPLPDALAFSENLALLGGLVAPAVALSGPALGYNLALLGSAVVGGLGAYLLVRRATRDRLAAFAGAAIFAAGSHRTTSLAHLHVHANLFLPFALLALDRFLERRSLGRALALGALVAAQGAASVYLGAITAVLLAVGVGLALPSLRGRDLLRLGAGAVLAAALLAPIVRPYLRMRGFQGEEFGLETVRLYATTPESYLASVAWPYASIAARQLDEQSVHDRLFPGVLPLLLGIAGLARAPRRYAALALAGSLVAVTLSLGPATAVYRFLHEHVVLFHGIRALARFSIVPVLALSVLAGLALAGRRRLAPVALVLLLAESWAAPIGTTPLPVAGPADRALAGGSGAVLAFPPGADDTTAMLRATAHFRPLVNGDSGFMPRPYARLLELLGERLDADGLRLLRAIGVTRVVSRVPLPLPESGRYGQDTIYAVPAGPIARVPGSAARVSTLWTPAGAVIDLGQAEPVSRVGFEVSEAPWVPAPRVSVSLDGARWDEVQARADLADATLALYSDPRRGRAELTFSPRRVRFVRLDARLPARPDALEAGP